MLVLGGRAPEYLRNNPKVIEILRELDRQGKWLFAICHWVQVLATAGLIRGKRVTCYEHVRRGGASRGHFCRRSDRAGRAHGDRADLAVASVLLSGSLRAAFGQTQCPRSKSGGTWGRSTGFSRCQAP